MCVHGDGAGPTENISAGKKKKKKKFALLGQLGRLSEILLQLASAEESD